MPEIPATQKAEAGGPKVQGYLSNLVSSCLKLIPLPPKTNNNNKALKGWDCKPVNRVLGWRVGDLGSSSRVKKVRIVTRLELICDLPAVLDPPATQATPDVRKKSS